MRIHLLLLLCLVLSIGFVNAQNVSVLTQHNNNTRSGFNNRETKLTTSNVNARQFGKAFTLALDDQMYSQPLVVANLLISGGLHNVVFLATVNNSIYAYDGDNGTLYWQKNYTAAGQRVPRNNDMTGACGGAYQDFSGNIGIVGTPVIDSAAQTIYFVARSTNNGSTFVQYLHALNIVDGSERAGSPISIAATATGNGDGSVNGIVSFDPQRNNQRQALTLVNNTVYVTFSSHCDWRPYHGWVLGYDKGTLTQKLVYNDCPNGYEAGLWESGCGPAVDDQGNLYIVTGNGSVGYNNDQTNLINRGESALRLTPSGTTLAVTSYYTPYNYPALEGADLDYGSMGSFLIPNSNYYFTGCKDGNLYLLNKDNMGAYNQESNAVQQNIDLGSGKTLRCQPSYFKGTTKEFVYVWSENDPLRALPFNRNTNTFDVNSIVIGSASGPAGSNGAELSVSGNNGADGTGIVWAAYAANGDANQSVRPGILRAFDANNITKELWNNSQNPERDNAGNFAKFSSPTIANGHVYLPTFSNQVVVYGVLDSTQIAAVCPSVNLALNQPAYSSANESTAYPPTNATDGNGATRWSSAFSDPQWIYVDLGQVDSICRVNLSWENALGKNFQIQVSNDALNWNTVATISNNTSFLNYIDVVAKGRYVRMYGTQRGTPYGYSLYEFEVNGKVLSGCQPPDNLSSNSATTSSIVLKWTPTGAASYTVQYGTTSSSQLTTLTTTADSITVAGLGCASNYIWQVRSVCANNSFSSYSGQSAFSTLPCANCGLLPTRVFNSDIGNVAITGQACYTGVTSYNIKGSGSDIQNQADQFRFVYKTFSNDGILQAKVTSQDQTNVWNKAGLMFRSTTDSISANVFMGITSANGVTFQYRPIAKDITTPVDVGTQKAPYFLRLVKQGQLYTGYSSPDSITWTQLSTTSANLNTSGPISGGLAVTSHDNTQLSTVQFDQVGFNIIGTTDVNLALNKPSYGSNYSDIGFAGNFANDGNATTRWQSLATADAQWYYVDLGQPFKLKRINIAWDAQYATDYQIQTSNDAVTWTTVQQIAGNTIAQNSLPTVASARFVRVNGTKSVNNNGFSIDEFQIFGDTIPNTINDLAKHKPVTSSSDAGANYNAKNAADADFTTRWASGPADPQWIYVDLGASYYITDVNVTWELDVAKNFDVQVSDDAANWSTIKSITNNTAYADFISVSGKGRYVRINATAKGGPTNYSIYDLQVLGSTNSQSSNSEKYNIANFIVYPNPTKGPVRADFTSLSAQDIDILVSDIDGKQLQKQKLSNFSGAYHFITDLTHLAGGSYVISLRTAKGIISKMVVKY